MKRRVWALLLCLVLLGQMFPMPVRATEVASGTCGAEGNESGVTWVLTDDGTLTISGSGAMKNFQSYSVDWYEHRGSIQNAVIKSGVTSIGGDAFRECTSLTSVTIPDGITSIGSRAFYQCTSLTSVTIPNSARSIGGYAFFDCTSLTSVTIPDGVTSIGDTAFFQCTSLTSVTLPDSVTDMGYGPFANCSKLTEINVSGGNTKFVSTDGVLFKAQKTVLTQYPAGIGASNYIIPDSVTSIEGYAFFGCTNLTSVTISNSVRSIGGYAFDGCTSLTSVMIPASVTSIGEWASSNCDSLTDVYYGGTQVQWETLKGSIRGNNEPLLNATIHYADETPGNIVASGTCGETGNEENVRWTLYTDGRLVISGTGNMADFVQYSDVPWYEHRESIQTALIENGITHIGKQVFAYCANLTGVTIPDSVTSIGSGTFGGCSSLTSVTIPDSVTSIGSSAFRECASLTSVTIPDNVTSIGDDMFADCTNLTSVTIPSSVTSIGSWAFYCARLTSVTIPASVTSIGLGAFEGCTSLTDVYYGGTQAQWETLEEHVDYDNSPLLNATIHYADETPDSNITASGTCGAAGNEENVRWTLYTDGRLVINGTGDMTEWEYGYYKDAPQVAPWYGYREAIRTAVIENGVTFIGDWAFWNCKSLTSVTISDGVTSIGDNAFNTCSGLTSVTIPDSVTSIGERVFGDCDSLTEINVSSGNTDYSSVDGVLFNDDKTKLIQYPRQKSGASYTIPDSVISIELLAFEDCDWLTSVTVPDSVIFIGEGPFTSCDRMTEINVSGNPFFSSIDGVLFNAERTALIQYPAGKDETTYTILDSVTSVGSYAFGSCTSLTSVAIPDSVTSIGPFAFGNCASLTSVTIPSGITSIWSDVFHSCTKLTSVTIPGSVTSVGVAAFADCAALTDIYYGGTQTQWETLEGNIENGNEPLLNATIHYQETPVITEEGYAILNRIPDMYKYEDQSFRIDGPLTEFAGFTLDGTPLTAGSDFTASEGSTRISVPAATFRTAGEGTHTIAVTFAATAADGTRVQRTTTQSYTVDLSGNTTLSLSALKDAVQYVPYSATVQTSPHYADLRFKVTDGSLPGDGDWNLDPVTGEITGIPQVSGAVYTFTVGVSHGDGETLAQTVVRIQVKDNTGTNVTGETDPGFRVITPIPNMTEVTGDAVFLSEGEFENFQDFYLDGKKQIRDVDYKAEEGSTRITPFAKTLRVLGNGEHTAAATFNVHNRDGTKEQKVSSQNFTIGVQPAPVYSGGGGGGGGGGSSRSSSGSSYAIHLTQVSGGTVKASTTSARSGTKVTLTLTPASGYTVKGVKVTGTNVAGDVAVTQNGNQYTFTMPGKQVTVTPTFGPLTQRVAATATEHGKLSVHPASAVPGAKVTITAIPENGYVAAIFSAWDEKGQYLTVKNNGDGTAAFTMPESSVQVGGRFRLDPGLPVTDIRPTDWFYEDARWAYRRGIMTGVTGTSWVPEDRMSTATAVVTLARLGGVDLTAYQTESWSVSEENNGNYNWIPNEWYAPEARWAARQGILTEDIFTGRGALPRAKLAVMLRRFLTQQGVTLEMTQDPASRPVFSDAEAIRTFGPEAEEAFQVLHWANVFRGDETNAMLPSVATKRSHLAATLHRLSEYIIGYWESKAVAET